MAVGRGAFTIADGEVDFYCTAGQELGFCRECSCCCRRSFEQLATFVQLRAPDQTSKGCWILHEISEK